MRTVKQQLLLVNIITTAAAILLAVVLLFVAELRSWKAALVRDIAIKAEVVGNQCTAALTFNAPKDAEEILGALRADGQIVYAAIYTSEGRVFAAYHRDGGGERAPAASPEAGHVFRLDRLDLTRAVLLHDVPVGSITVRMGLDQLRTALLQYVAVSAVVLLLAVLAAWALLSRLQRTVTDPVVDLVLLMERVSRDKDYSRRAEGQGPKELASLAGSFNEMLAAIQSRDRDLERSLGELREAYARLEDLDQLKSDFISTVSHELRTPITSIRAFAELLMIKPDLPDVKKRHLLGTIDSESQRLTRLINDLLDLSRIESGVMQWRDEELDVASVVEQTIAGIEPLAQNKHIEVRYQRESGLPRIRMDRDRLMQVLMNLLSNAIKFTAEGGRILVQVTGQGETPGVVVSVEDTGIGIPAADLGRVFEKFQRSGDVLTSKVDGTGLGLTICRQIVEHYGGRIWASSEEGKGSRFSFFIPCSR